MNRIHTAAVAALGMTLAASSLASAETLHERSLSTQVDLIAFEVTAPSFGHFSAASEDIDTTLAIFRLADPDDPESAELIAFNDDDEETDDWTTNSRVSALLQPGHYLIGVADFYETDSGDYTLGVTLAEMDEDGLLVEDEELRAAMGEPPSALTREVVGYLIEPGENATRFRVIRPDGLMWASYHVVDRGEDEKLTSLSQNLLMMGGEAFVVLEDASNGILLQNEEMQRFTLSTWDVEEEPLLRLTGDTEDTTEITIPADAENERVAVSWGSHGFDIGVDYQNPNVLVIPPDDEEAVLKLRQSYEGTLASRHPDFTETGEALADMMGTAWEVTIHAVADDQIERVQPRSNREMQVQLPLPAEAFTMPVSFDEPTELIALIDKEVEEGLSILVLDEAGELVAESYLLGAEFGDVTNAARLEVPATRGWLFVSGPQGEEAEMMGMLSAMMGVSMDGLGEGRVPEVRFYRGGSEVEAEALELADYTVESLDHFKRLIPTFDFSMSFEGEAAPAFDLPVMMGSDEEQISLASLEGKVVVIDFWATWCGPCIAAMPSLQALHEQYEESGEVVVLGIVDEAEQLIRSAVDRMELTFPQLNDADMSVARAYAVTSIPRTIIVDRDGNVAHDLTGFHGEDAVADYVAALLGEE